MVITALGCCPSVPVVIAAVIRVRGTVSVVRQRRAAGEAAWLRWCDRHLLQVCCHFAIDLLDQWNEGIAEVGEERFCIGQCLGVGGQI